MQRLSKLRALFQVDRIIHNANIARNRREDGDNKLISRIIFMNEGFSMLAALDSKRARQFDREAREEASRYKPHRPSAQSNEQIFSFTESSSPIEIKKHQEILRIIKLLLPRAPEFCRYEGILQREEIVALIYVKKIHPIFLQQSGYDSYDDGRRVSGDHYNAYSTAEQIAEYIYEHGEAPSQISYCRKEDPSIYPGQKKPLPIVGGAIHFEEIHDELLDELRKINPKYAGLDIQQIGELVAKKMRRKRKNTDIR